MRCETYPDDMFCPRLGSKHAEDASATSYIKDGLSLEQVAVIDDGVAV